MVSLILIGCNMSFFFLTDFFYRHSDIRYLFIHKLKLQLYASMHHWSRTPIPETRSVFADHYNVDLPLQSTPAWCPGRVDISVSLPQEAEVSLVRGLNLSARALKLVPWGAWKRKTWYQWFPTLARHWCRADLHQGRNKVFLFPVTRGRKSEERALKARQACESVPAAPEWWTVDWLDSRYVITLSLKDQRKLLKKICRGL